MGSVIKAGLAVAGMKEVLAAGTATVAGMAGEGTLLGGVMAGVGDLAAQGYDVHAGNQTAINWKQTGKSTLAGGAAGFVMGGAMGMFSLTSAGQAFGKWMSEPTKLDLKAAEMVKSFWGNNRGSVGFGAKAGGSGTETDLFLPDEFYNKNLPRQVKPGTKYLPKYDEFGNIKQIKIYDDYGREIGWVDYTNHGYGDINSPNYHVAPHWHERIYNAQNVDGMKIHHRTDNNTPLGDK